MDISINTHFHPFRMVLARKKPIQLTVELINRGEEEKIVSLELMLSRTLSLDKSGLVTGKIERIPSFKPGEKKKYYFDIYQKAHTTIGEIPVILKVYEHYRDYKYIQKEFTKNLSITVQER